MADTERRWNWETDPKIIDKKCAHCKDPLRYDRASVVKYRDELYHSYCLLDMLTDYHWKNSGFESQEKQNMNWFWGAAP